MMRNASEWIPLWMNEGLAEFYQNTDIQEKEVLLESQIPMTFCICGKMGSCRSSRCSKSIRLRPTITRDKQIEFSATNFTPKRDLNPCTDMEGLKAKVQYAEVTDKSVAGQVISAELSK